MGETEPLLPPARLVVGLGNPGPEYEGTRHNLGFEVLDRLAGRLDLSFRRLSRGDGFSGRVKARIARGRTGRGDPFLLVKPWAYMNLSGVAVAALARRYELAPGSIFVIYDDLNLPLGRIRIRPGGGPGGHNGMRSLSSCLGSEGFPRCRIGIGRPDLPLSEMADPDFVLGPLEKEERRVLAGALEAAVEAASSWLDGSDPDSLMNRFNGVLPGRPVEGGPPAAPPGEPGRLRPSSPSDRDGGDLGDGA